MVRVFITGSSSGIGLRTAQSLIIQGHEVVLHARNEARAAEARESVPETTQILIADLRSIAETKRLAKAANELGPFDSIIHCAGVGYADSESSHTTVDNVTEVFAVNTLAPYILAGLMNKPRHRIMFMSSDSHWLGDPDLSAAPQSHSYADTKFQVILLGKIFGRRWPDIKTISLYPGWVNTKLGGKMAPLSVDSPARVMSSWADGRGPLADVRSGAFSTTMGESCPHESTDEENLQDQLVDICRELSGVFFTWPPPPPNLVAQARST